MIYYSKISYTLLIVIFIVFFGPLIPNIIHEGFSNNMIMITLGLFVIYGLILHMFFNTTYTIDQKMLHIRCGFFRYKPINIMNMKKISKSSSIVSSPAASFDRIEITYDKFDELIISPKHKLKFIADLQKINPNLINTLKP
jgi:hypothetical protein